MSPNPFDLTGKVALVTGANSGLGLGFAEGIARAGGDVVIWGRREAQNEIAAQQLKEYGGRVLCQSVDVSDESQVDSAMADAIASMGRLDCVIANAGINNQPASFADMTTDEYREVVSINQFGAFYTLRGAVRHMMNRYENGDPGGSLILCGSLTVVSGVPRIQHYASSKGAMMAMTRSIAVEYGRYGIRANMVLPGRISTDLGNHGVRRGPAPPSDRGKVIPIPRMGVPEDCAGIVVYLMSDASAYHTGTMIPVDGGLAIALRGTAE